MKKLISGSLVLVMLLGLFSCKSSTEGQYSINGALTGQDSGFIFLKKRDEGKWITVDSVKPKEGKFTFTGKVDLPEMYYIGLQSKEEMFPFFVENAVMELKVFTDSLDKSTLTGSATDELYRSFLKQDEMFNQKMETLYDEYMAAQGANDTVKAKSMEAGFDAIQKEQTASMKDFILKNGKSVVSAYLALSNAYSFELDQLKEINKAFDPSISASKYVKKLMEREEILSKLLPGNPAPDFTMNDTTGKAVSLSSLKGKVVLVDFWASWCGPCRRENPNVVEAYKKFSPKGFTILGVSLDREKDKWIEAIHKDGLTWSHVSDLQGWDNAAAKTYGVMSIPANFLLDKEGKILGSSLRGEDLEKKLSEVLGEEKAEK